MDKLLTWLPGQQSLRLFRLSLENPSELAARNAIDEILDTDWCDQHLGSYKIKRRKSEVYDGETRISQRWDVLLHFTTERGFPLQVVVRRTHDKVPQIARITRLSVQDLVKLYAALRALGVDPEVPEAQQTALVALVVLIGRSFKLWWPHGIATNIPFRDSSHFTVISLSSRSSGFRPTSRSFRTMSWRRFPFRSCAPWTRFTSSCAPDVS